MMRDVRSLVERLREEAETYRPTNPPIDLAVLLRAAADQIVADAERINEWQSRYRSVLEPSDKLLHEIRFCSNSDELWRMVGMSQEVEELHNAVIYELDALDALSICKD